MSKTKRPLAYESLSAVQEAAERMSSNRHDPPPPGTIYVFEEGGDGTERFRVRVPNIYGDKMVDGYLRQATRMELAIAAASWYLELYVDTFYKIHFGDQGYAKHLTIKPAPDAPPWDQIEIYFARVLPPNFG